VAGAGDRPEAFEVGAEVREIFCDGDLEAQSAFAPGARPGKWLADLYLLARFRLIRAGVVQVAGGSRCTYREGRHFYSYRRDGITGRFASLVWLDVMRCRGLPRPFSLDGY
jgi:polyphenol oxidase